MDILNNEFNFTNLLLEGGGMINGSFLKEGLIDELSILIYPGIDGLSGMPAIIDYKGAENDFPAGNQTLEFIAVETLSDGIVWLRYKLH